MRKKPKHPDIIRPSVIFHHRNEAKGVVCLLCILILVVGLCCDIWAAPHDSPSLSEVVFFGLRSPKEIDYANYPPAGKSCAEKYLGAVSAVPYFLNPETPDNADEANLLRKRNLRAQMIAVLGRDLAEEIDAFVKEAPLGSEWEGMREGPLNEADFADKWLNGHPECRIAPFLHLFRAHRLRAGYEAACAGKEKSILPDIIKQYREALNRARLAGNPLISCLADDLEAQTYVYLEGFGKP